MSCALTHRGLPDEVRPFQLTALIKKFARVVDREARLSKTAVVVLEYFIGKCRDSDFQNGRICGTWEQPATMAAELGISAKVYHNAEAELRAKGFIERTSISHARRHGERRGDAIVALAGVSLAPAINRYSDLKEVCDAADLRERAAASLRSEIGVIRQRIRDLGNAELIERSEQILPRGRKSRIRCIDVLEATKAALEAILVLVDLPTGATESSHRTEDLVTPNIPEKDSSKNCSRAAQSRKGQAEPVRITAAVAASLASDDYRMMLAAKGGPDWPNLVEASATACSWLGISQQVWGDACQAMGRETAALCVLIIDRNCRLPAGHRYKGREPAACLRGMTRKRPSSLNLSGLLRAMQGYQEGDEASIATGAQSSDQLPEKHLHSAGNLVTGIMARMRVAGGCQ